MACLRKENTTTIRVKEVSIIRMVGATDRIVIKNRIFSVTDKSPGSSDSPIAIRILGIGTDWLWDGEKTPLKITREEAISIITDMYFLLFIT